MHARVHLDFLQRHGYVLPRDINKDPSVTPHEWEDSGATLVGYRGTEQGEIV